MPQVDNWPIEYGSQLEIGNTRSNIAICCLWSLIERIKNLVDRGRYCVIGNLYSRAGVNAMLRNILANPLIRHIVLTGKSVTDSGDALVNFFTLGVDQEWKIIENGGQIDPGFPRDVLEEVRRNVRVIDLRRSLDFARDFEKVSRELPTLPPFAEPRLFVKTVPIAEVYPSEFIGLVVRSPTIIDAWEEILWTIMTFGKVSPTDYGLEQREVLGLLSIIQDPGRDADRLPSWAPFNKSDIDVYVAQFFNVSRKQDVAYQYADRLSVHWGLNQVDNLIAELRRSRHSRRAVATLWDPGTDARLSEPPCITIIQVAVRADQLYLTAYIRSNDMFRAYPLNAFALAALQNRIASGLRNVAVGPLSILSLSAHIYSDCWDTCQEAASTFSRRKTTFEQDPRGSFAFRLENGQVVADHYSPAGDLLETFSARDVAELENAIVPFVGRVGHSIYLGRELMKLRLCQESGEPYVQDRI